MDKILAARTIKEPFVDVRSSMRCMVLEFTWTPDVERTAPKDGEKEIETPYMRREIQLRIQHDDGTWSTTYDKDKDIPKKLTDAVKALAEEYLAATKSRMGF
jgi:hypothetical protein